MEIRDIPIDQIRPNPSQPRKFLDESKLRELADSIRNKGLLEEILVRPKDEYFEIVHGERRWRACKLLGLETIKAKVEPFSDEEAFELSLTENIQRENLLPIEEARAYRALANKGLTHEQIAEKVNKGRTYITQKLRMLRLPFSVQLLLNKGQLSEGHIRQLLRLEDVIGRHENLKRANSVYMGLLKIGKYPFKSWISYYQDYFAWHITEKEKLTVAELKERIDKFYFDLLTAIILSRLKLTSHQEQELQETLEERKREEYLTGYERNLFCRWFEDGLRKKMGLSQKTLAEKDWRFWNSYGYRHGLLNLVDPEE